MKTAFMVMTQPDGTPLYQADDKVLWVAGKRHPATLFQTETLAERAIKSSLDHSHENGYTWNAREYRIVLVVLPPERRPGRARLVGAVRWALGEVGHFPERPTDGSKGAYYWRNELRRRAGI